MHKFLFLLFLLACLVGCGNSKKQVKAENQSFYLSMEKTPCFGKCPVYTLGVNEKGELNLNAKRFNDLSGEFEALLSDAELNSLVAHMQALEWSSYEQEYLTGYSDLPSTVLTFISQGDTTFVRYESDKAPQELMDVATQLENWKEEKKWKSLITE